MTTDPYIQRKANIPTMLGRLLYEISWEGNAKRHYREGGRGRENVLTAEVLQVLDCLPRIEFLRPVIASLHGASETRARLAEEIESAELELLPADIVLAPSGTTKGDQCTVQPDGSLTARSVYALIEAKRMGQSSFQPHQLAREIVASIQEAGNRTPLLMLLLGEPPPVLVQRHGRLPLGEAIELRLEQVIKQEVEEFPLDLRTVRDAVPEIVCWTTWHDMGSVVAHAAARFTNASPSVVRSVERMAKSLVRILSWHSSH